MKGPFPNSPIIRKGSWIYCGRQLSIWIRREDFLYSDDIEDPDQPGPAFYIWYEQGAGRGDVVGGGGFLSLEEAIEYAETKLTSEVIWE